MIGGYRLPFFDAVFTVLIKPLELLFEVIFALSYRIIPTPAVNLIIMSLAINFLVLPLYRRADVIQMNARDRERELRPMSDHIKKYFKGDERVMIMQTFYRQEKYSPLSSMKSLISLLLQIPFFIAAFQFLSHLSLLEGVSMGPIKDLSKPDALLVIGGTAINVLPVLMTIINIISSEIYTHGQPFKDKIVLYISAAIFLVLLYNSPSGLVFYWTFNNVFSLAKNIFYKLKNPGFVFKCLCALAGLSGIVLLIIKKSSVTNRQFIFLMIIAAALVMPIVLHFVMAGRKGTASDDTEIPRSGKLTYLFSVIYLTLLTGLLIPSQVVSAETSSFVNLAAPESPVRYVWYTLCVAAGLFIVWISVFYLLSDSKWREIFTSILFVFSVVATVDYLFFGTKLGIISSELVIEEGLKFGSHEKLINSLVVLAVVAAGVILLKFLPKAAPYVLLIGMATFAFMGIRNCVTVSQEYKTISESYTEAVQPEIQLSRNGRNVVVIMLDRAAGFFVPSMMREKPSLKRSLDGFTYYPNTVSFGCFTLMGAPGLFGGYEYTPEEMNKRPDMLLADKYMESLMVMPQLFTNNGYKAQILNVPLIYGHNRLEDLKKYDGIDVFSTENLMNPFKETLYYYTDNARYRNFFIYSIFKVAPSVLQESVYSEGNYHSLGVVYDDEYKDSIRIPQTWTSESKASGADSRYLDNRYVLEQLPSYTTVLDDNSNHFFMFDNEAAHQPTLLSEPDYVPSNNIDNVQYDKRTSYRVATDLGLSLNLSRYPQMASYHVNMATYIELGQWFDHLRENGCWDNTRIIIVSDHARSKEYFGKQLRFYDDLTIEDLNCVLMVKDFDSKGFESSWDFMTNADTPVIATNGLIDDPVNPFTGNPINDAIKQSGPLHIFASRNWRPGGNTGTQYPAANWYSVQDNIFDRNNWEYLGEH